MLDPGFLDIISWASASAWGSLSRLNELRLRSEIVLILVDSLYAEAIETEKSRAALSASIHELISTLEHAKAEARLWNRSQSELFNRIRSLPGLNMIHNATHDRYLVWIYDVQHSDFWEPNIFMDHNVQNIASPIRHEVGR
jgi:hypothetical protein